MSNFLEQCHSRRAVLSAGAMGIFASTVGATAANPLPLGPAMLNIPEVDALTLQVVTDAATFGPFLDDLEFIKIVRLMSAARHHSLNR